MNRNKHQLLWLMLPAVLVVLYFAIFQPGAESSRTVTTEENIVDTGPAQVEETDSADIVNNEEPQQEAISANQQEQEVAEDREFINYAFPVLSKWNLQEVKPLLAEVTIAASSDEELNEVMSVLEDRLGDLKYFETPELVATANIEPDQGEDSKLQQYQFIAYYETGEAEIDLVLHRQRENNSLYSFNIHVAN